MQPALISWAFQIVLPVAVPPSESQLPLAPSAFAVTSASHLPVEVTAKVETGRPLLSSPSTVL